MASYTMQLREYIEMWSQNETLSTRDQIEKGRTHLFDFDYPIFDADYKKVFETHFIRTFFTREIGFETEGLFKFHLETWLLVNMPYYNKLFESELITFDPLTNTKIDTTQKKTNDKTQTRSSTTDSTNNGTSEQTSNSDSTDNQFARHLESNTPDSRLTITTDDGKGVIEYASQIQENTNSNTKTSNVTSSATAEDTANVTSSGTGEINEIEDYLESKVGKIGDQTFAAMLNEYRTSILRIEKQIFKEMQELFMLVY
jgi:hypothetical protein